MLIPEQRGREGRLSLPRVVFPCPHLVGQSKAVRIGRGFSREEKLVVTFVFVSGTNSKEHTAAVTVDQERSGLRVAPKYFKPPFGKEPMDLRPSRKQYSQLGHEKRPSKEPTDAPFPPEK